MNLLIILANCELCSDLEQCSFSVCSEDYYNTNHKPIESEFERISKYTRCSAKGSLNKKVNLHSDTINMINSQSDSEFEKFFEKNSEKDQKVNELENNQGLNLLDVLLERLENRIEHLKENLKILQKLNLKKSLFKKNLIHFFEFLKLQEIKNLQEIAKLERKIVKETNLLTNLQNSEVAINNIHNKLNSNLSLIT